MAEYASPLPDRPSTKRNRGRRDARETSRYRRDLSGCSQDVISSLQEKEDYLLENAVAPEDRYARECLIRDLYAGRIAEFRPSEKLLKTEYTFAGSGIRADMRTVDNNDVLRVWEFKISASYEGLGQALTYLALARVAVNFARPVKAVLAAFEFKTEVITAVEVLNLGIELVVIPSKLRLAGGVPLLDSPNPVPEIPHLPNLNNL